MSDWFSAMSKSDLLMLLVRWVRFFDLLEGLDVLTLDLCCTKGSNSGAFERKFSYGLFSIYPLTPSIFCLVILFCLSFSIPRLSSDPLLSKLVYCRLSNSWFDVLTLSTD